MRGELTAAGFEVSTWTQDPALGDVRTALETVGRELEPIATFAIVRAATDNTAEIWVCDRIAGKSVIQSVRLDAAWTAGRASPSAVLAVQAVELLKASLAQYWLARSDGGPPAGGNRHRRRPSPPAPARPTRPPGSASRRASDCSTARAPLARCGSQSCASPTAARAAGRAASPSAAWEPTPSCAIRIGSAQVQQAFGLLELLRGFRAGPRVQPFVAVGAGAYRARVVGVAGGPNFGGSSRDAWSVLGVAGGGVVVPVVSHVALVVAAQVGLTVPDNLIG